MLDVEWLRDHLSSRAFAEWMAYASVEPFGEERADLRSGIVAAVIANVNRDPKRQAKPFTPQDFMPFIERPAEPPKPQGMTPDEITQALLRAFPKPTKT